MFLKCTFEMAKGGVIVLHPPVMRVYRRIVLEVGKTVLARNSVSFVAPKKQTNRLDWFPSESFLSSV